MKLYKHRLRYRIAHLDYLNTEIQEHAREPAIPHKVVRTCATGNAWQA